MKLHPRIPTYRKNSLGFWEEILTGVASGFFGGGGAGGSTSGGNSGPAVSSNVVTQVSPVFQTQISPNISPIFQQQQSTNVAAGENIDIPAQTSGGAPMSATTSQNAPATFTATPTMNTDIAQSAPARAQGEESGYDETQISPVYQTPETAPAAPNWGAWIIGGLALIVVLKAIK